MQVLEAADGAQAAGWPAFHKSKVHASPLLYDVDSDGVQDILVATYDGQILAFRDTVRPFTAPPHWQRRAPPPKHPSWMLRASPAG